MSDKFEPTRQALDRYWDHQETADQVFDYATSLPNIEGSQLLIDWLDKEDELRIEAGKEFVKVTPNSEDKACIVDGYFRGKCSDYNREERTSKNR